MKEMERLSWHGWCCCASAHPPHCNSSAQGQEPAMKLSFVREDAPHSHCSGRQQLSSIPALPAGSSHSWIHPTGAETDPVASSPVQVAGGAVAVLQLGKSTMHKPISPISTGKSRAERCTRPNAFLLETVLAPEHHFLSCFSAAV